MKLLKEILDLLEAKSEVVRGYDGKPLRGLKKEIALKSRAPKWDTEASKRDKDEVYNFGKAKVQKVSEEAIEVKEASDVWAESKDTSKTYISRTVYSVKGIEGGEKFDVSTEEGSVRKQFATLSRIDLDKSFTPIRPNQSPDAEGYTQYRDVDEVEAFKYEGDTVKVDLGGEEVLLSKGDYLVRKTEGNDFVYEVKTSKIFDSKYTAKK